MRVTLSRSPALTPGQRRVIAAARLGPLLRISGDALGVSPRSTLSVRLTDDRELRELNARFAGRDGPTDVLAFPAREQAEPASDRVGDVAISVERAMAQNGDGAAELRLLAVHGLLHCLGHDHLDHLGSRRMAEATRLLLPGEPVPDLG